MSTTSSSFIKLTEFSLTYSSLAYSDRSLKTHLSKVFKQNQSYDDIKALQGINLEIRAGERVALIGHNGAGKSSLLRAIAEVYPGTSGSLETNGRVRALFELHLGFELDATGRENIKYRSLLLGATPKEIKSIESEIIDFTQLNEVIDMPIRTYSSGMLLRLGFGIATAFDGEILLLDEVIAAGDLTFYARAKDRLNNMLKTSQIVIIATHDLVAAKELCNRAIVLNKGSICFDGNVVEAIEYYVNEHKELV